ncbi:4372_t:CDS:2 [Paraglomus occultum]|uniref:4372_t:CDS:1 n=1 Tax=Paraglomus occultum TaxID=144539 RepID=A0A9N9CEX3_9GLOM|nr:4372_t:CDS:2 [Paraglomus occultum]
MVAIPLLSKLPVEVVLDIIIAFEGDTVDKLCLIGHINRYLRNLLLCRTIFWKRIDLTRHKDKAPDALVHILNILPCKSLKAVSAIILDGTVVKDFHVQILLPRFPNLRFLSIRECHKLVLEDLHEVFECWKKHNVTFPNLNEIDATGTNGNSYHRYDDHAVQRGFYEILQRDHEIMRKLQNDMIAITKNENAIFHCKVCEKCKIRVSIELQKWSLPHESGSAICASCL